MSTSDIALAIKNLSYRYPLAQEPALEGIDFSVPKGAILGLLGANGAGKSTLVSLITGTLTPDQGQIDVFARPASLGRSDVACVPQDYAFYERLTIEENLDFFAGIVGLKAGDKTSALMRVKESCGLGAIFKKRSINCSGGEKRRLNFAIAILREPHLLILDEPTANVDPLARETILQLLSDLNQRGTTIIYTSHLLHEVEQLCDSLVLIDRGKQILSGEANSLIHVRDPILHCRLREPADIAATMAQWGEKLNALGLIANEPQNQTLSFQLKGAANEVAAVIQALQEMALDLQDVKTDSGDLESLFLSLVQGKEPL